MAEGGGANRVSGGRLVVDCLLAEGLDTAFSVAGESYLDILDALVDAPQIRLVTCRQEGGAAYMAEAYGKLTGRPAVLLVTRGPGACNAAVGVHTAHQDSTPMLVLVGQVARHQAEREAFQEVDVRRMYGPLAKWVAQIDLADRIPEMIGRAVHVAVSGRPGPVVLACPEDMLRDLVAARPALRHERVEPHADAADLAAMMRLLGQARRPLVLVGGGGWHDEAAANMRGFLEANALAACCSFRRQDIIDNGSASYVGDLGTGVDPALLARLGEADLLLAVGARLGEITTQSYRMLPVPQPDKILIHCHPAAEELGQVFRPHLAIQSGVAPFAAAARRLAPIADPPWRDWAEAARADYRASLVPPASNAPLDLGACMQGLRERLPDNAIITIDAGNFAGWPQRFLAYRRPGRQLGPTSGAMGYAVPAAIAASLRHPDRLAMACVGDGGFLMTGQELATAVHEGAAPLVLLFNNGMYGTIRMHQERRYPGRVSGTDLTNPDFAALARAYGAFGARVARTQDFLPTFEEARRHIERQRRPAVIELATDSEQITTRTTIAALRAAKSN
jgi:acetolactate synthase-1/2/3 large subunit